MHKFLTIFLVSAGLLATNTASAQSQANSPYSRFGIGDLSTNNGSIRNFSMGGSGVVSPNSYQINELNPALLYFNNNVIFELNVNSQLKTLKEDTRSQRDGSANLGTIGLAIPVNKRWSAALGLKPYSTVQYETNSVQSVTNDPNRQALVKYSGQGGLSEVYFGHGVKVLKDLTIGATASYVFGTIDNMFTTALQQPNGSQPLTTQQLRIRQETNYHDFAFKTGLAYRRKMGKYNVGIGGVYNLATDLKAERRTYIERLNTSGLDQTKADSTNKKVTIPSGMQLGLSLDNGVNWSVNADVALQNWSEFKNFEGNAPFENTTRFGLGGEIVPEPASPKYLRRVTYRAGFSYGQTQYVVNNEQLKEAAVTWGFTLPLGRSLITESSFLNLGFALGKRGTTDNNLVQENFIRAQVGLSLNNKWFIQRKLD